MLIHWKSILNPIYQKECLPSAGLLDSPDLIPATHVLLRRFWWCTIAHTWYLSFLVRHHIVTIIRCTIALWTSNPHLFKCPLSTQHCNTFSNQLKHLLFKDFFAYLLKTWKPISFVISKASSCAVLVAVWCQPSLIRTTMIRLVFNIELWAKMDC